MAKMKGIYKGFKYISNIFVVKEQREMEIGFPTDVKHVAHIGWDGQSNDSAPSWMKEFNTAPDFSTKSVNELGGSRNAKNVVSSWSSRDLEQSIGVTQTSSLKERSKKKQKRKKIKSATSSPKSSSTSKASRSTKSKPSFAKSVSQAQASPSLHGILLQ